MARPAHFPARVLRRWLAVLAFWAGLLVADVAAAQPVAEATRVSLVTFGVGDHPFSRFGHNALLVHGDRGLDGLVYNFGTFQFDSPLLIVDFLQGKLKYWLSVSSWQSSVARYRAHRRDVRVQTLALNGEQVRQITEQLRVNAQPENRFYLYDYYQDNCSTRVRDVLDRALVGKLHQRWASPTTMTYRDHTRRLTEEVPWLFLSLDFAMGLYIDRPLTHWEAAFLPAQLEQAMAEVRVGDSSSDRLLVDGSVTIYDSGRPRPPTTTPDWSWSLLILGLVFAFGLACLGRWAASSRTGRVVLATLLFGLGAVFGGLGVLLLGLWLGTNHEVTYRNANVLLSSPLALGLCGLFHGMVQCRPASVTRASKLAAVILGGAVLGYLACMTGLSSQRIGQMAAWFLPMWGGVVLALRLARVAPGARSR